MSGMITKPPPYDRAPDLEGHPGESAEAADRYRMDHRGWEQRRHAIAAMTGPVPDGG